MAASNFLVYGAALASIGTGGIDLDTDTFVMALLTSAYTPAQSTHSTWADVSAAEVAAGNGYTSGGKVLSTTTTRSGLVVTFDAGDQAWDNSTITAKYAVIVKRAGASLVSTDKLVAYSDLSSGGGSLSSSAAAFSIAFNAAGIFTLTASAS